jgi:hypothetical protein
LVLNVLSVVVVCRLWVVLNNLIVFRAILILGKFTFRGDLVVSEILAVDCSIVIYLGVSIIQSTLDVRRVLIVESTINVCERGIARNAGGFFDIGDCRIVGDVFEVQHDRGVISILVVLASLVVLIVLVVLVVLFKQRAVFALLVLLNGLVVVGQAVVQCGLTLLEGAGMARTFLLAGYKRVFEFQTLARFRGCGSLVLFGRERSEFRRRGSP